jgi:hypothetical protein
MSFHAPLVRRQRRQLHSTFQQYYRPFLELLEDRLAPSVNVLGYHNNLANNGEYLSETTLTPANVNVNTFGKRFSAPVDGQVYAQPLYVSNVLVTMGTSTAIHNVVYVATEHDSLYAIDADEGNVLWHDSFINPAAGVTSVPSIDANSTDLAPEIGITGTPVIDLVTNTLFLVAKTKEVVGGANHYVQRLHAIDIGTGKENFGGPVTIADTIFDGTNFTYVSGPFVFGSGDGSVNGKLTLNALRQLQRTGLTLYNGNVYFGFGSHNDTNPYHGWVLSYNDRNLHLNGVFNTTPNGIRGGIWQGGGRIAIDSSVGYLYLQTGNGTFDTTLNQQGFPSLGDYGDSFVKLTVDPTTTATHQGTNGWGLRVVDYFTPFNQAVLGVTDLDVGSGGPVILPDSVGSAAHPHLLLGAGKEGRIYLIDRDNMGHFNAIADHIVQEALVLTAAYDSPAYLAGIFYYACHDQPGLAFSILNGTFKVVPASKTPDLFSYPGSTPSISANGSQNRIVWLLDRSTNQLRAYDARNLATELYTSAQAPGGRDRLGPPTKFAVPTVANGMVYVGTFTDRLVAYGLLNPASTPIASALSASPKADSKSVGVMTPALAASITAAQGASSTAASGLPSDDIAPFTQTSLPAKRHLDDHFSSTRAPHQASPPARASVKTLLGNDWLGDIF